MYIVWNFGVEMLKTLACRSMDRNAAYFAVQKVHYRIQHNKEENTTTDGNNFNRKEQKREQLKLGYHHASRGDKCLQYRLKFIEWEWNTIPTN